MTTLSLRQLNRATLERQLLLRRSTLAVPDAVEHLLGLQAQVPLVPYTTLWSRLEAFTPAWLADPLRERTLVRASLMRSTVHLVSADDALRLRPHMQVVLARAFGGTAWARTLRQQGADLDAVMAAGRRALDERPRNRAALGPLLAQEFPGLDVESMTIAVTYLVPVVQATPRGVWGERAQPRWMTMSGWLGDRQPTPLDLATLVQRYLRAFGPATVKDVQAWCGLTRLREVADGLGSRLRRYRSDDGAELLDLADATLPDPDTPAPVRFLAEYDNATLGYADRRRILADGDHEWLAAGPGGAVGSVLVDGHVRATWALRRSGPSVSLEVHQAVRLDDATRAEVEAEAQRLLDLLTDGGTEEGAATVWWSG